MTSRNPKNLSLGFTLIELIIVAAIIAILSSVIMAATQPARIKSRDTTRIGNLSQIELALQLYYEVNHSYPPSSCGYDCNGYFTSNQPAQWATFRAALAPYMTSVPVDPINTAGNCGPWGAGCYSYSYGNVGNTTYPPQYDLTAQLEDATSPYRCGVNDYRSYFGGTTHWCTAYGGSYSNQIYEVSPL